MAEIETDVAVTVLSFGPLAEVIGRKQQINLNVNSTSHDLIMQLGIESWLENGLTIAINGKITNSEIQLLHGDEVALLPPVSGG